MYKKHHMENHLMELTILKKMQIYNNSQTHQDSQATLRYVKWVDLGFLEDDYEHKFYLIWLLRIIQSTTNRSQFIVLLEDGTRASI